jgi:hypothetical protein
MDKDVDMDKDKDTDTDYRIWGLKIYTIGSPALPSVKYIQLIRPLSWTTPKYRK